eukprot:14323703-Alexandrium_andersonii.AAC.1
MLKRLLGIATLWIAHVALRPHRRPRARATHAPLRHGQHLCLRTELRLVLLQTAGRSGAPWQNRSGRRIRIW